MSGLSGAEQIAIADAWADYAGSAAPFFAAAMPNSLYQPVRAILQVKALLLISSGAVFDFLHCVIKGSVEYPEQVTKTENAYRMFDVAHHWQAVIFATPASAMAATALEACLQWVVLLQAIVDENARHAEDDPRLQPSSVMENVDSEKLKAVIAKKMEKSMRKKEERQAKKDLKRPETAARGFG